MSTYEKQNSLLVRCGRCERCMGSYSLKMRKVFDPKLYSSCDFLLVLGSGDNMSTLELGAVKI